MWRWVLLSVVLPAAVLTFAAHALQRVCARPVVVELAALQMRGKPVTAAEAAPPPVPAQHNAAPLYLRAHALMRQRDPDPYSDLDSVRRLSVDRLLNALREDGPALDLLREASLLPSCRFDIDYESGLMAGTPPYVEMRRLSHLTAAAAVAAAMQGEQAQAAGYLQQGLVLSRHVCDDGTHLGFQVATSFDRVALEAAERVLQAGEVPPTEAWVLSAEIGALDYNRAVSRAMDSDRAGALDLYDRARRDPRHFATVDKPHLWGLSPSQAADSAVVWQATRLYLLTPLPWLEQKRYLRIAARAEELASRPWRESRGSWAELDASAGSFAPWSVLSLLPFDYGLTIRVRDEAIARRGLLQAALALNRHRAQHDAFPATLSEVRIEGLPIPEDVFSGKPFVYRNGGDGFTLYSIGPNLRDDGGMPYPDADDVVWRGSPNPL